MLEGTDIILLVTDSTFENINGSREIIHDILDNNFQDKLVIGIANKQDLPNRLTPELCERILSSEKRLIRVYGMDATNSIYREKILAILRDAIIRISNGKEEVKCEECGNTFTREYFELLKKTEMKEKELFYCPKCKFPLYALHPKVKPKETNEMVHFDNTNDFLEYLNDIFHLKDTAECNLCGKVLPPISIGMLILKKRVYCPNCGRLNRREFSQEDRKAYLKKLNKFGLSEDEIIQKSREERYQRLLDIVLN